MARLRMRTIIYLSLSLLSARAYSAGGGFAFEEVLVCPVGWTSEQQILDALDRLKVDILTTANFMDGRATFSAPIAGRILETERQWILENDSYRIAYPRTEGGVLLRSGLIPREAPLIEYQWTVKTPFLVFIRNPASPFGYEGFANGEYTVKSSNPAGVFAALPGFLVVHSPLDEWDTTGIGSTMHEGTILTYIGVDNLRARADSNVTKGMQLGAFSRTAKDSYLFKMKVDDMIGAGELNPIVLYVEVLM